MPNSVLEAMAHGLPVVTSAVGGIADFFEDGRMGFSTRTVEPTVLAGLIERLIADPGLAARMGQNNRIHAERCFAAPKVAQRLVAIYSRVIDDTLQSRN
jgi:glycosyltransferase involved in cell wall biosynthesis